MPIAEYWALKAFIALSDGAVQVSRPASGLEGMLGLSVEASVLSGLPVLGLLVVLEVLAVLLVVAGAGVLVVAGVLTGAAGPDVEPARSGRSRCRLLRYLVTGAGSEP